MIPELDTLNALLLAGWAEKSGEIAYVKPISWKTRERTHGPGPRFRAGDIKHVQVWDTRTQARAGALAIGWPVNSVSRAHTHFGNYWGLVDGRFGYLARESFQNLMNAKKGPG